MNNEEELRPQEVKFESLTKDELVKLCNDKTLELSHYSDLVERLTKEHQELLTAYNRDCKYLSTINSNLVKVYRKKEDAVINILNSALSLMTVDREEIAPEREEDN